MLKTGVTNVLFPLPPPFSDSLDLGTDLAETIYFVSADLSAARSIFPNMCPPIAPCCHVPA